jgi:uncharacterized membrane protein YozB (DUF420 family)
MTSNTSKESSRGKQVRVVIHSFFIVPFLTAVFGVLLFAILKLVVDSPLDMQEALATIARWTLPIWLYISVTGIIIYRMLYHIDYPPSL